MRSQMRELETVAAALRLENKDVRDELQRTQGTWS
jgi:hypothetical protein